MRLRLSIPVVMAVLLVVSCGGAASESDGATTSVAPSDIPATSTAPTTTSMPSTTQPSTTVTTEQVPPPVRMDDDGDGVPCETVYPASEVEAVLEFETGATAPAGWLCRDVHAAGYGFDAALAYWIREGRPVRMDADDNGLPCETVYGWDEIMAVMTFDGADFTPPPPLPGVTIDEIVHDVQARLQAAWEAQLDHPEGIHGPFRIECTSGSNRVTTGDVFACAGIPDTARDFELDPVGFVFTSLALRSVQARRAR